jgi:hypothetical protein
MHVCTNRLSWQPLTLRIRNAAATSTIDQPGCCSQRKRGSSRLAMSAWASQLHTWRPPVMWWLPERNRTTMPGVVTLLVTLVALMGRLNQHTLIPKGWRPE